ncbi:tripartite tricarboxylate transporter TctB family protein [Pararhodobacter sp. SW119]|uniref:tripartite tricarboxylate transporter TctB family protein n=1 Tax=Pararhodobacter sp. SW119 TaxID=2780075 RepID=UPI001AE0019D|nr:tripartite tricarboxylate transporter TctB family protein [Pararhodobacter sp. SW119]
MDQNARADMIAGLLVCGAGIVIAVYAYANYPMGSLRRMGPGMFPMGSGSILALLGLVLAINSWRSLRAETGRDWPTVQFELRTAFLSVVGVVAFALLLRPLGLIPAVLAVVGISALSDGKNTPLGIGVLALFLAALATIIFKFGLGMSFPLFAWNWS